MGSEVLVESVHRLRLGEVSRDVETDLVAGEGYERWERWAGGARESFRRTATALTVARTDDVSMVARVRWAEPIRRNVVRRMFVPTSGDWHVVDLPVRAWPLYSLIRPVRHLAERLGFRRPHEASLGPFLTTPDSLLPAGARIVVHEQSEFPGDIEPPPSRSELLVSSDAVTVAHLWMAPGAAVS